jgi:hypothetical protein
MQKVVTNWVAAVSTIGSLVALAYGLLGHGPGPRSLWILVAYIALAFGLLILWWDERARAGKLQPLASAFVQSLIQRCDDAILEWRKLATLYQNSAKEQGDPVTLQDPMHPGWASSNWKVWPYKVGRLQGSTADLYSDVSRTVIEVKKYEARTTLDELLDSLRKCREQLSRL